MNKINMISLKPINYTFKPYVSLPQENKDLKNSINDVNFVDSYLANRAIINIPLVKNISFKQAPVDYKNNLRTMIHNNESVMLAIAPRTFTAEDKNGDEKISLTLGEKPGTFLSAISRLDELKNDGINTIHILPIHPPGLKNAMGTAGSLYSPARFL